MVDKEYIVQTKVLGLDQVEQLNQDLGQTAQQTKNVGTAFEQTATEVNKSMKNAAEEASEGFTRLQTKLRQTQTALQAALDTGDGAAVKKLRAELGDLEDSLDVAKIKSQQFDDVLSSLPGPAGAAGNAIKSVDGAFKLLAANPIIAVIGALVGVFLALKESLSRTEEGQAKLTKITEGFEKVLNGLFAVIEPIAMVFADLVGSLLSNESVMNGLSKTVGVLSGTFSSLFGIVKSVGEFIVNNLVNGFTTLIGVAKGAGEVIEGVFTFDFDKIKKGASDAFDAVAKGVKKGVDNVKNTATGIATAVTDGFVKGFESGEKSFNKGLNRLTKAQQEADKKAKEEAKKAAEERAKQRKEIEKKAAEDAIKAEQDLAAAQAKTEQEKADVAYENLKKNLERDYNAKMAAAKKVGADTTNIEKTYLDQKAKAELDYQAQVAKIKQDEAAKAKEKADKEAAENQKFLDDSFKNELEGIKNFYVAKQTEILNSGLTEREQEKALTQLKIDEKNNQIQATKDAGKSTVELENQLAELRKDIAKKSADERKQIEEATLDTAKSTFSAIASVAEAFAGESEEQQKKAFEVQKAAGIANAIIDTYSSATAAFSSAAAIPVVGPVLAPIAAAAAIAAGIANIRKIQSTTFQSKSASGGGGAPTTLSAPSVPTSQGTFTPTAPSNQTIQSTSTTQTIDTATPVTTLPQKVYVLSGDVTSAQQADAKINERREL